MKKVFLTNQSQITFLDKIKEGLRNCTAFYFSVSFIKKAGLVLLIDDIKQALKRGANGKIITSTYQNFTDIPSLNEFLNLTKHFPNFNCHIDYNSFIDSGFHSKGYIFEYDNTCEIVIGSSNITRYALLYNIEWNVSVISKNTDPYYQDVTNEFNHLWNNTLNLNEDIIKIYSTQIEYAIERWDMDVVDFKAKKIRPNYMQRKALKEISKYRARGVEKALIVAATGSGKTYLAAFDALNFNPQKLLFIVHRENILNDALKTFTNVFGNSRTYGLFTGENKEPNADFIFSTNQTMSRNLAIFARDDFDYIIIDEVHHATASSYTKIIEYFTPSFLLGLTATPERMDNESVFDLFEKNVPYELRLREALENNLIVPFKYYGIKDNLVDYSESDTKKLIKQISSDIHCEFIKENIENYRHKITGKLKALGFCRNVEHSRQMAESMNLLGYNTLSLTGENRIVERNQAFTRLQDENDPLEIIFTVDILNEGIDIPGVNMVLFLRPTESSTIFIQQLGRGLRLYENKDYLVVLDFIGNSYTRSVQIALALGTLSNNIQVDKRLLASLVTQDFKQLNLPIEIHLDEESKEEILRAIEKTNFNNLEFLKQDYYNFKKYINAKTYLKHIDFINNDAALDLQRYIKKFSCFYEFLKKVEDDIPLFNEKQVKFLKYLSSFLPLVRHYEYNIIKLLIDGPKTYDELMIELSKLEGFDEKKFIHSLNNLMNKYYSEKQKLSMTNYLGIIDNKYRLINFEINDVFSDHLKDIIDYGLTKFSIDFYNVNADLKLYYTYTRQSLLQVLCNHTFASREGLIWNNGNLYIFIDLKKDLSKEEHLLYDDNFISSKILQWESSTSTTLDNKNGRKLLDQKYVFVFVRKIQKEDGIVLPYIYLGRGELTNPRESNNPKNTLLFDILLDNEVPEYLKYDFEIENEE